MMVFMWRSNKKRTAQQQELRAKIQPGAEVMTQSGIFGTLLSVDEASNVATLETSPGVEIRVHSQTIAHVVEPKIEVPDDASELTGDTELTGTEPSIDETDVRDTDVRENDANDANDNDGDTSNDERPKA
ncbi:preprotein translocase subunit YajC [Gulosibacter molinativorax]|uniref:Preprotein translocase subunit YajC n=2 Tax=Gulosibacter molinativorax TaxID=256821 RepID=A0ABT7C772_9MICO|nr:preprotein translocase subunit YajC [Gulosibacter molinativorax]